MTRIIILRIQDRHIVLHVTRIRTPQFAAGNVYQRTANLKTSRSGCRCCVCQTQQHIFHHMDIVEPRLFKQLTVVDVAFEQVRLLFVNLGDIIVVKKLHLYQSHTIV
jgi:hypothetical protein